MKLRSFAPLAALFPVAALTLAGCSHNYYVPPPPPPPVVYQPAPGLLDLANRNGYQYGVADGQRDSYNGYPFSARRTPAYRNTPGYDGNLGPYGPYRNAFRLSYLHGYDSGYYHR